MRDCRDLPHCISVLPNCSGSAIAKFRSDTFSDQKAQVAARRTPVAGLAVLPCQDGEFI
jgi:hypothetical protein